MKKTSIISLIVLLISTISLAQTPEKISYQAVIRNADNTLVTNTTVGIQISILQGSENGTAVYTETQTPITNTNGLFSIEIGTGTTSDDFSVIDWSNNTYFIQTEIDPTGGSAYTITGTSQLLSVPYALHAKTADTVVGNINETDPVFNTSIASKITEADTTNWNNKLDTEVDGSVTNELQTLSISNDTIYLSNGNFVILPEKEVKTYAVGDTALGGMVIKVNAEGTHGLVMALTDQAYDGSDANTLVDFNEAACLCKDTSRFDEAGKEYLDWRLPYWKELIHLPQISSYQPSGTAGALMTGNIMQALGVNHSGDAGYYWFADVMYITEQENTDLECDDDGLIRRLNGSIYSAYNFNSGNSSISDLKYVIKYLEYDSNVRCVRSF